MLEQARPGSPQPMTAAAARAASSRSVASQLAANTTEYAICPGNPSAIYNMVQEASAAHDAGIPAGSKSADEWGFKKVREWATALGARWMRPRDVSTPAAVQNELWFAALCLVGLAREMPPSARRKARGFEQGQPSSALLALYGWRRVQRDCGRHLCDMSLVRQILKGICLQYRATWGPDAFIREQCKVFALWMLRAVASFCLNAAAALWTHARRLCWSVLNAFLASTGTRKNEFTRGTSTDTFLTRYHFTWVDDNFKDLPATREVIESRRNGHFLRGMSCESKCDRLNLEWGAQKQWFVLDDSDPLNFAYRWQQWELAYPCPPSERQSWAAFSPKGDCEPYTPSAAARDHHSLLDAALGAEHAADHTIHSYRATLASALGAARDAGDADITDGAIQMVERWKTVASVRTYDRVQPAFYARLVAVGTNTDGSGALRTPIPTVDPGTCVDDIEAALAELDVRPKKRSATQAACDTPATSAATPAATTTTVDVGSGDITAHLKESWGIVGDTVDVPNELWGLTDGDTSTCTVTGFIGTHAFGNTRAPAYAICDPDGNHYPIRASYLATIVTPPARRAALRKKPAPRVCTN